MINTFPKHSRRSAQQGIVLLEALIAILIFSIGILGVVGLQAVMIKNTADARFRSEASVIAQQRIGQIWSDPNNASFIETDTDISAVLPGGKRSTTQTWSAMNPSTLAWSREFLVTVTWTTPSDDAGAPDTHNYTMLARLDP